MQIQWASQILSAHYSLGLAHGKRGISLKEARVLTGVEELGTRSCSCYVDGLYEGHNGTHVWGGGHDPECTCGITSVTVITQNT